MNPIPEPDIINTDNIIKWINKPSRSSYTEGVGEHLFKTLKRKSKEEGNKIIQIDTVTDIKITYENFLERCIRFAVGLKKNQVFKGDVICCCLADNDVNSPLILVASLFIGAIPVFIDAKSIGTYSFDTFLNPMNPKYIFIKPALREQLLKYLLSNDKMSNIITYSAEQKECPCFQFSGIVSIVTDEEEKAFQPTHINNVDEMALLLFTSGTEAAPKLVPISHSIILHQSYRDIWNVNAECKNDTPKRVQKYFTMLTFNNLSSYITTNVLFTSLIHGVCQLLFYGCDKRTFWKIYKQHKPYIMIVTIHQMRQILRIPCPPTRSELSVCRRIIITGEYIAEEFIYEVLRSFPSAYVYQMYGSTEFFGSLFGFNWHNAHHYPIIRCQPACCGMPMMDFEYKIRHWTPREETQIREEGELRVKSSYIVNNYRNFDYPLDANDFYQTGDIASYGNDFRFFITGRLKYLMRFENRVLNASYFERILSRHQSVDRCVVVGIEIPHKDLLLTEIPVALVTLRKAFFPVTPFELKRFFDDSIRGVSDEIYRTALLEENIYILIRMPLTATDKIARGRAYDIASEIYFS